MTKWRKASYSGANNCLEVAVDGPTILMRNSHDPHGPRFTFSIQEFDAFIQGVKDGEFDIESLKKK